MVGRTLRRNEVVGNEHGSLGLGRQMTEDRRSEVIQTRVMTSRADPMVPVRLWVTLFSCGSAALFLFGWLVFLSMDARLAELMPPFRSRFPSGSGTSVLTGPRILACLALAIGLCLVQIVLVWKTQLGGRFLVPIVVEAVLGVAIAVASSQALAGTSTSCFDRSCVTTYPTLHPWGWIAFCVSVGLVIGGIWSYKARQDRLSKSRLSTPTDLSSGAPS
jgi:hypothetical protein